MEPFEGWGANQSRTQFSIWAILAAPMLIGGPVSALSSWDLQTYLNKEVIAVSQDPLVSQGTEIAPGVWARLLHTGSVALVMANAGLFERTVSCDEECWSRMPSLHGPWKGTNVTVRDLWSHGPPAESALQRLVAPQEFSLRLAPFWSSRTFKLSPV